MATKTVHNLIDFAPVQESGGLESGLDSPALAYRAPTGPEQSPAPETEVRYGFEVAGYHFMVPPQAQVELLKDPPLQALPSAPPWIRGLTNFHGEIIPVIDMDILLDPGSGQQQTATAYALTIDNGNGLLAIMIDAMPQAIPLSTVSGKQIETPELFASHVSNTFQINGEVWFEIDINRLVAARVKP